MRAELPMLLVLGVSLGSCTIEVVTPKDGPYTVERYGKECRELIAEVPSFSCFDGVEALVTVDGVEPGAYTPNMDCDRPALLPPDPGERTDGQCVPHSRALVLRDDEEVQISAFCRKKLIRDADSPIFDEIDVILHSVTTGTTCWFHADPPNPDGDPAIGRDGRAVPSPTLDPSPDAPPAEEFWNSPVETASAKCGDCHDNDPFYYSPYIAQTGQMPRDPLGRYNNDVGPMREWNTLESLTTRGNTCVGCHRIGVTHTCGEGLKQSVDLVGYPGRDAQAEEYPHSHWMPVDNPRSRAEWEVTYQRSIDELLACCDHPETPGCAREPIAGIAD